MNCVNIQRMKPSGDPTQAAPPKPSYHHGDVPGAILAAALRLIAAHGVEGFSLREAALAIGVSPSAVYRHFAHKADLLAALSRDGFQELSQHFESAMASAALAAKDDPAASARAQLAAQGQAYVQFALAHPERFQVMFSRYGRGAGEQRSSPFRLLEQALDALCQAGLISPGARPGAEVPVWAAIHGLACLLIAGALDGADPAALTQRVNQSILAALGSEA